MDEGGSSESTALINRDGVDYVERGDSLPGHGHYLVMWLDIMSSYVWQATYLSELPGWLESRE